MADKKKGKRNKGEKAPAAEEAKKAEAAEAEEKAEAEAAAKAADQDEATAEEAAAHGDDEADDHDHAHGAGAHAHAAGPGHAHEHKPNIKEYMVIFGLLALLTVLEVGVTKVPGIAKGMMTLALIGLALTKAGIVALYYMHLKHETRVLKMTVAIPMAAPTIYALVLISEAAWRLTR